MNDERAEIGTSSLKSSAHNSCLSGTDAITLLEIIHSTISCKMEADFRALFPKIQELFPFEFVIAATGHYDERLGTVLGNYVNISFPDGWMREYMSRDYFQLDAVLKQNFTIYEVQNWSSARKRLHRLDEITSLGMDFGLRECCTHGVRSAVTGEKGSMFCFAGKAMEKNRRAEAILKYVVPHLHMALSHISGTSRPDAGTAVLSSREKDVLDWLKQGKSSWDISVILDISERTVNFHVYNIMQKLGATNRPQIVAIAARLGLIGIE
ncbi:MAG: LuxR C-terminal-related transcriptional regulator [Geobacteraceae bacterium]|nr:LuxR C-terminal-related transcriptional regulator [Geobacteraceae bacterium]